MTTQLLLSLNPEASRIVFDKENALTLRAEVADGVLYIRPTKRTVEGIATLASFDTKGRGKNKIVIASFQEKQIEKLNLTEVIDTEKEYVLLPVQYGWYALLERENVKPDEWAYVIEDGAATFAKVEKRTRRPRNVSKTGSVVTMRSRMKSGTGGTGNIGKGMDDSEKVKPMALAASAGPRKRGRPRIHDPEDSIPSFRKRERIHA